MALGATTGLGVADGAAGAAAGAVGGLGAAGGVPVAGGGFVPPNKPATDDLVQSQPASIAGCRFALYHSLAAPQAPSVAFSADLYHPSKVLHIFPFSSCGVFGSANFDLYVFNCSGEGAFLLDCGWFPPPCPD